MTKQATYQDSRKITDIAPGTKIQFETSEATYQGIAKNCENGQLVVEIVGWASPLLVERLMVPGFYGASVAE